MDKSNSGHLAELINRRQTIETAQQPIINSNPADSSMAKTDNHPFSATATIEHTQTEDVDDNDIPPFLRNFGA